LNKEDRKAVLAMKKTALPGSGLSILLLSGSLCVSVAQSQPKLQYDKQGRTDNLKEQPIREENQEQGLIFKSSQSFEKTIKQPEQQNKPVACEAEISLDYSQEDTQLRVDTVVNVAGCEASDSAASQSTAARGTYRVRVRTREAGAGDLSQEIRSQTYQEDWQRLDAGPLKLTRYYPLPDNSVVVKAQVQLRQREACWCGPSNAE
jgi:hypothetical protein